MRAQRDRPAAVRALKRLAALACLLPAAAASAAALSIQAVLIVPGPDPRLDRSRLDRQFLGHPGGPVSDGLRLALEEGRFELDAAEAAIVWTQRTADSREAAQAAARLAEQAGAAVLVVDLPTDWTLAATDAVKLPVVNVGDASDRLREQDCRPRLFHTLPSERMRIDAIAQTLVERRWRKLVVLVGPTPQDQERGRAVQQSIVRHGLQAVAAKPFKLSGDPRQRELANIQLLTAGETYDAVWVIDGDGEFARSLPYRTALPRPVVGDGGLVAVGWHSRFERFGAPQVSRRFARAAGRPMTSHDWSAWMAGKALVAAVSVLAKERSSGFASALGHASIDGSKGFSLGFRAWDGQLRQPLLLTDGQGVIAQAPVDGLLHPTDVLDTLGADAPEKRCKAAR
ncbi:Amino acid/amide ABC transporter substrate-binding protein, HAAT family [Burkholderiales bacterium 8X]|nr:Amino acid/amide ABC transporter substrate-binding protein, HAAT family [Burkholderiales bacterium 8X]